MSRINFFAEDIRFKLRHPRKTKNWLTGVIEAEGGKLELVNYIFCSDNYLLKINQKYLNHNTYTDIITFDQSDQVGIIEGDIYISVERIVANSKKFAVDSDIELHRVLVHGILHLLGYTDKNSASKSEMRLKEDAYLSLRD